MLSMTVARRSAESQDNYIGAKSPDHPHHIAKNSFVATPFCKRFLGGFAEPEINCTRKILLRAIDSPCRQKFLRADHAQRVALLRTNQILPALATRERKITGSHFASAREIRQNRGVF